MTTPSRVSPYDSFAWIYNRYWGPSVVGRLLPMLDRLLMPDLPPLAHILDVGCGTGWLAQALSARGYHVTGIDSSAVMLAYATENAPTATFVQADARNIVVPPQFHAVISTSDSLNHVIDRDDLLVVLRMIAGALLPGGRVVLDMTTPSGYEAYAGTMITYVEDDHVCLIRLAYAAAEQLRESTTTVFRLINDQWHRSDVVVQERGYDTDEMVDHCRAAGLQNVAVYDAQEDFALHEPGRLFVTGERPAG